MSQLWSRSGERAQKFSNLLLRVARHYWRNSIWPLAGRNQSIVNEPNETRTRVQPLTFHNEFTFIYMTLRPNASGDYAAARSRCRLSSQQTLATALFCRRAQKKGVEVDFTRLTGLKIASVCLQLIATRLAPELLRGTSSEV